VNRRKRAGLNYAASAKLFVLLAFIFNVSLLTQTGQTAARLSGFHTPVETSALPYLLSGISAGFGIVFIPGKLDLFLQVGDFIITCSDPVADTDDLIIIYLPVEI